MIGQTISHYKILEKLGEGGMGVVYKAQDLKLDRIVALKFLPSHLSSSEEEKTRFVQEARAEAALSHPNICPIHDIQEHQGQMFIVMDCLEGRTLRERKQDLSLKHAVDIGIQIADGLAAAHEKGIVHRDIKPENIMIRKDGIVQIMDFGLAKLRGASRLTKEGSTVGTVGYMSPEQVQGLDADHRSDIFSLGVILYEMFAGEFPFKGVHETALMYEIVNVDPAPISSIKPAINVELDRIVLECLQKEPDERYQAAKDVSKELKRFKRDSSRQRMSRISTVRKIEKIVGLARGAEAQTAFDLLRTPLFAWSSALLFLIITVFLLLRSSEPSAQAPNVHAVILLPEKQSLLGTLGGGHIALSRDGTKLAFAARDSGGTVNLWVQSLSTGVATMLPGTQGAIQPFWAPDNHTIGFFASDKLKRIDAFGGPPSVIAEAPSGRGGSWNESGTIVFSPDQYGPLMQVSATGGPVVPVTELDSTSRMRQITHRWPHFLPDGRHFLFYGRSRPIGQMGGLDSVYVGSLDDNRMKTLFASQSGAVYVSGYLVFTREATVVAQRFDLQSFELEGQPLPIADRVEYDLRYSRATLAVSENGILIYQQRSSTSGTELTLHNQNGKKVSSLGFQETYVAAKIAPDGKRIAADLLDVQSRNVDIWIFDANRSLRTRFTFDPAIDYHPVWSPDGSTIAFSTQRGHFQLYTKSVAGPENEQLLLESPFDKNPWDWSADGKWILFGTQEDPASKPDLWVLPMTGERKPVPFLQTPFYEGSSRFSPDTHWIAYTSDESGRYEVYVRPFPGPGGKWQVSMNGGSNPRWRRDGKELYFVSNNKVMAAQVNSAFSTFQIFGTRQAFDLQAGGDLTFWDLSGDGKLMLGELTPERSTATQLVVVSNWLARLNAQSH